MKKKKKIFLYFIVLIFVIYFLLFLWQGFFSNILPWTKTYFASYEKYEKLLDNHHFYATYRFIDDVPQSATSVKYYVHRNFREKYASHSIILNKEEYERLLNEQMIPYYDCCDNEATFLVYQIQSNQKWNIIDLENQGINMDFLSEVMQSADDQQEYYCLILIKLNTTHGTCYTGIIGNDITNEMIEFSVEIPDENA